VVDNSFPATSLRRSQGLFSAFIPERLWAASVGFCICPVAELSLAEED
jgi:hypothetical protein